jgi:hypothetical protein
MSPSLPATIRVALGGLALTAMVTGAACSSGGHKAASTPTTLGGTTTTLPELNDGLYGVYIKNLDLEHRAVIVEVAQFYTGAAAKRLWLQAHPGDTNGPPGGFLYVRDNPIIRTYQLADTVEASILQNPLPSGYGTPTAIPLTDLPAALQSPQRQDVLFDMFLKGGKVVKLFQVFAVPPSR